MAKPNPKAVIAALDARKPEERVLLLLVVVVVLGYAWLTFVHDPLAVSRTNAERRVAVLESQIVEESNRQAEIRSTFSSDPNSFARSRQRELLDATAQTDQRLNQLYGELISPRQMAQVLGSLLQSETSLRLVSLENLAPQPMLGNTQGAAGAGDVQIFRHGLHMVFEGEFLETVRFLRSLEQLDSNFFWENLEFQVTGHPRASISLDIFTLSAERGWIGV